MVIHRRARVLGPSLAATMILSIIVASVAPISASADTVSDKKAEAVALARQINAQGRQVEILAEQYNGAQLHAAQVEQQLADAQVNLAGAQATAARSRAALSHEAVLSYIHGGFIATPQLSSLNGSSDLTVEQGYFKLATTSQVDALDRLRLAEQQLRQRQAALQAARHDAQAALANAASHQREVQQAAAASQATLDKVQGQLVDLVAQQQNAIAADQLAQGKAKLLATLARQSGSQSAQLAAQVAQAAVADAVPAPASAAKPAAPASTSASATGANPPPPPPPPPTSPQATTAPKPAPPPPPAPPPSHGAAAALNYARAQLGKPYQWGGSGPNSFDCSGLTMMAWAAGGVSLSHFAAAQYSGTAHVAIANLQPGDLVFFGSSLYHVGIYVGGGQMIHAPHTGAVVSYASIYMPDLQPYGGRP